MPQNILAEHYSVFRDGRECEMENTYSFACKEMSHDCHVTRDRRVIFGSNWLLGFVLGYETYYTFYMKPGICAHAQYFPVEENSQLNLFSFAA